MKLFLFRFLVTVFTFVFADASYAQTLHGNVVEFDKSTNRKWPLPGAVVRLAGSDSVVVTDSAGIFNLPTGPGKVVIVTSYTGYMNDTTPATATEPVTIMLRKSVELKEVNVTGHQSSLGLSKINPINTEKVTSKELQKAACCNLSESFETNPTINVAYTDAVTGAKEIRMLGLSGIYSQLLAENIPTMRGIAGLYGLTFIPGPWMESIQVTKGSGSVLNSYEATTGQLNVEFRKPQELTTPKFYLNVFGEGNSNMEVNTWYRKAFSARWSSILMAHGNYMNRDIDLNGDGFLDMPHSKQVNLYNRWQYESARKNVEAQIGLKFLADKHVGGQVHDGSDDAVDHHTTYISDILNRRVEVFGKLGFLFPSRPGRSIGNIASWQQHELGSIIGLKHYDATQQTFYYQGIWQDYIGKGGHEYKTGVTFQYDRLDETYNAITSLRTREIPGAFFEYAYSHTDRFKAVAGVREDYNSRYGWNFIPRLHLKYSFNELTIIRASAGKSFREPYLLADNISLLASSKSLLFGTGIVPEQAWNYGLNFTRGFPAGDHEITVSVDAYRTEFIHQVVIDRYSDTSSVSFYNLEGSSYANSLQISVDAEITRGLDVRVAAKGDDVRSTYAGVLQRKPLVPRNRLLVNVAYATENEHWKLDATWNRIGTQQLANSTTDPLHGKQASQSPAYSIVNFQVTRAFRRFDVYAGAENLLDFTQENPIVAASNPFSPAFDASNIWGPLDGIRIYGGLRYQIK